MGDNLRVNKNFSHFWTIVRRPLYFLIISPSTAYCLNAVEGEITKKVAPATKSDMNLMPSTERTWKMSKNQISLKPTFRIFTVHSIEPPIMIILNSY